MHTHVTSVGLLVCTDPALNFSYPDHIPRACLDALPPQPGIYIFRDEAGIPVYIGKSVNIRHRVLSHLRTAGEAQMLARTRHIDHERTGGEIGALLREAQLIKQHQPVFNVKLRRTREMCSIRIDGSSPQVVFARELDFGRTEGLFGLFQTPKAAQETLRELAQSAGLCAVLTGLEKGTPGRPCFARQIKRCHGACTGEESPAAHAARMLAALAPLKVAPWPYPGPIAIVEKSDGLRQRALVDNWCYLGTSTSLGKGRAAVKAKAPARFDVDVYRILAKPLLRGELTVESLQAACSPGAESK
ncbi:endonuclease [Pseudoduganella buxea]|uniref:Excinuclease cho n=1 Tax=Pseudoduganella buxea TaxID=1949069 RepID=A0A6I3T1R4_9BURK|nr:endonuclease [Pseudoduganella buxea]MTV54825.1 endonuclease [Pseudoduganella buxea]GGC01479.1 nucleotide excision repair endonuclease [Pseudoduganella buxea]